MNFKYEHPSLFTSILAAVADDLVLAYMSPFGDVRIWGSKSVSRLYKYSLRRRGSFQVLHACIMLFMDGLPVPLSKRNLERATEKERK